MPTLPAFDPAQLQAVSDYMADILSHAEIGQLLSSCGIEGLTDGSRRARLLNALTHAQGRHRCGNKVVELVGLVMKPARYVSKESSFEEQRQEMNRRLAFAGYEVKPDGTIVPKPAVATLSEAQRRANRFRAELLRRCVHGEVIQFCGAEIRDVNYFHTVLEAAKSLPARVRKLSGLPQDGHDLYDRAFGIGSHSPRLVLNTRMTAAEQSEHTGLVHLLKSLFSLFRNPTAHEPKIHRVMTETDALEAVTMISGAHRILERVTVVPAQFHAR